jgi:hypothetical protein
MQIKNRQQLLVYVAVGALALFAADRLLLEPLIKVWNARTEEITRLRTQVAQGKALLLREQSIRSHWAYMQRNTLTNNASAAEQQLFAAIEAWRQNSRVVLSGATPQWKKDSDDYMTYQCRLDASGNLPSLTRFLYDIEKDPMALKLESIELAAHDKEGQQLSLAVQISALVLTPQAK